MKKTTTKKTPAKQAGKAKEPITNLSNAILLKEHELQQLPAEYRSILLSERKFKSVSEIEQLVLHNSKTLFGEHTILIRKEKERTKNQLPNTFLIDYSDLSKARFYIIDVMANASSLFARITRFLQYLNAENTDELWELIVETKESKVLTDKLKGENIPYFLLSLFRNKPAILLISDSEIPELVEIKATYSEWQKVQPMLIKKYASNGNTVCSLSPDFSELKLTVKEKRQKNESAPVSEEDHLRKASEGVQEVYKAIKTEVLQVNNQLQFNPQKYYISLRNGRNIAFFHIHKKNIALVVMNPEKDTRKVIKHHVVKTLTEKVQKFWNGPCCTIMIESTEHLPEVINLLKRLITA